MVFRVISNFIYECPEHGEFKVPNIGFAKKPQRPMPCMWTQYDNWGQPITAPCMKSSRFVEERSLV